MNEPVKLICLDIGGVLMRIRQNWDECCEAAHLALPEPVENCETRAALLELSRRYERGEIDETTFDIEAGTLTGAGPEKIKHAAEAWLLEVYPMARQLVEELAAHPAVTCACLSNTNTRHWRMMQSPGPFYLPLEKLAWRFVSFEIGRMKPDEAIYREVERVTGLRGESILFFDDHPANVAAAKARGWRAERVDPSRENSPMQVREALKRLEVL